MNEREALIQFLGKEPNPSDKRFHEWAEANKLNVHDVEAEAYKLATMAAKLLSGGRAKEKGFTEKDADPEELKMGIEVEKEHVKDDELAKKISLDHLAEISIYYSLLQVMEEEGKKVEDEGDSKPKSDKKEASVSAQPLRSRRDYGMQEADPLIPVSEVRKACSVCADTMEAKGIKAVRASVIASAAIHEAVGKIRKAGTWALPSSESAVKKLIAIVKNLRKGKLPNGGEAKDIDEVNKKVLDAIFHLYGTDSLFDIIDEEAKHANREGTSPASFLDTCAEIIKDEAEKTVGEGAKTFFKKSDYENMVAFLEAI